jgi:hypothetical protein
MNSVHFKFENEILSFDLSDFFLFEETINDFNSNSNLGFKKAELTFESYDGSMKLTFIPDNTKLAPHPHGFTFNQYRNNFGIIPFNDISRPHKLYFSPLGPSSLQIPPLCVAWSPYSKSYGCFFRILNCIEALNDNQDFEFESIEFFDLDNISKAFQNEVKVYHASMEGYLIKIDLPIGKDALFHYIDDEGNEIGTAPIFTFNELVRVLPALNKGIDYDPGLVATLKSSFIKDVLSKDNKQKKIILKYLMDSLQLFKMSSCFYAPFVTICQSSGVGKSKFILECGEELPLIYGVFRASSDNSYPPMSDWIKNFADFVLGAGSDFFPKVSNHGSKAKDYSLGRVLLFIDAMLKAFIELFEHLKTNENTTSQVIKDINLMFYTALGQARFNSLIEDRRGSKMNFIQLFASIRKHSDYFAKKLSPKFEDAPFVIVFDELSLLLEMEFKNHINLFHIIRRALHLLPPEDPLNLLVAGIGTNGDVSIFHKELNADSLRYITRNMFLPPLILGSNWDIFKNFIKLNDFKLSFNNVLNTNMIKLLCSFGRAMWSSLPFTTIIPVAQKKLVNGSETTFYTSLAIWSIRTGLSLNSDLVIARTLLRSYMAIAYSISYDSESMNIGYPSEPILAIAARDFLKNLDSFSFKCLLQNLCEFVQMRPVDKGEITENIFSLIVLLAIDNSPNFASQTESDMDVSPDDSYLKGIFTSTVFLLEKLNSKFDRRVESNMDVDMVSKSSLETFNYHVTTVECFLKKLFGEIKGEELSNLLGPNLRNGLVNATHVISALRNFPYEDVYGREEAKNIEIRAGNSNGFDIIDQAFLRSLFIRQAMLKMPPRYPGLDMCIPVLMKRNLQDDNNQEGLFGYIGLQYKSTYTPESIVIPKMDPEVHYVSCGKHESCTEMDCRIRTRDADLNLIYQNHLMIYMAATFIEESVFERRVQPERVSKAMAIENMTNIAESESDSIAIGKWNEKVPYIVTRSIKQLSHISDLIDDESAAWIQNVIHAQNDPFKNVSKLQYRMVADNVLNLSSFRYAEADSELRPARGFEPLADPFSNTTEWFDTEKIKHIYTYASTKKVVKTLPKNI